MKYLNHAVISLQRSLRLFLFVSIIADSTVLSVSFKALLTKATSLAFLTYLVFVLLRYHRCCRPCFLPGQTLQSQ